MMLLQPECYLTNTARAPRTTFKIPDYETRRSMHTERIKVNSYKSTMRGNPAPFAVSSKPTETTDSQRMRYFAHALVRLDSHIESKHLDT